VDFLAVYILEAHACDEWPINNKIKIPQHQSLADRIKAANDFKTTYAVKVPLVVDSMKDQFVNTFAAWPERYYLIKDRKIAVIGHPGPMGYNSANWPKEIRSWITENTGSSQFKQIRDWIKFNVTLMSDS
jgi:hypothetical protein